MHSNKFQNFVNGLITQDYVLFGTSLLLFVLFIVLAILLRRRLKTAIFLVLTAFCIVVLGPTYGYIELHKYLFQNKVALQSQKKLEFVEAVVIKGELTNTSKYNFQECKVIASAYKVTANKYKNYILELKPFKKMSMVVEDVKKGETQSFKMIMEPFRYQNDYNISLEADCQ